MNTHIFEILTVILLLANGAGLIYVLRRLDSLERLINDGFTFTGEMFEELEGAQNGNTDN